VVLVGPDSVAVMKRAVTQPTPAELEPLVADADIVIREGFKQDGPNRIEVFRSGVSGSQPLCVNDRSIIALVSSVPLDVPVPRFDWDDAAAVADFITKL
jgi:molybdopterin-guanine dinucleotide biosynthesis protein MobB